MARKFLKLKYVAINIVLFFVAFFLTTPEYIVSQTDWLVKLFGETLKLPAPIVDFLPTILLWSFTALLPLLVAYSDRYVHWKNFLIFDWLNLYSGSLDITQGPMKTTALWRRLFGPSYLW